jgi:hypothetical protein
MSKKNRSRSARRRSRNRGNQNTAVMRATDVAAVVEHSTGTEDTGVALTANNSPIEPMDRSASDQTEPQKPETGDRRPERTKKNKNMNKTRRNFPASLRASTCVAMANSIE